MKVTWIFAWLLRGAIRPWATCGTLIFWEYRLPFRTSMGRQMPGNGIDERLLFSFFPLWFPFFFTKFPAATARWSLAMCRKQTKKSHNEMGFLSCRMDSKRMHKKRRSGMETTAAVFMQPRYLLCCNSLTNLRILSYVTLESLVM